VSPKIQHPERIRRWLHLLALGLVCSLGLGATPAGALSEYLLTPGDILKISVFKNPDLSLDV
jgi:protein involved in polysaccharide export with SLBB domain